MSSWSEDSAETASFLGVVPPLPLCEHIQQMQREVGVDASVLPHVTVKSQLGLIEGIPWRKHVAATLGQLTPFELVFSRVAWFGAGIVYLAVDGPIGELHRTILAAVEAAGAVDRFEYDGEGYVAHLTLGAEFAGATQDQLAALAAGAPPLCGTSMTVAEIVEFRRAARLAPYVPTNRFPLGP